MNQAVIVSGVRTPVGRYMGGLKTVEAFVPPAILPQKTTVQLRWWWFQHTRPQNWD